MRKVIVLLLLLFALLSCDRFEYEIYQNAEIETMFAEFTNAIAGKDTLSIISFFDENYKHYGDTLATVNSNFVDYVNRYNTLTTNLDEYYQDYSINWTLSGILPDSTEFQKIKSFSDYLISAEDYNFKFYGNQFDAPPAYDPDKPMLLAQYSTYTDCGGCPTAANKLAELKREYGGQFIYLDYVSDGPNPNEYDIDENWYDLVTYYPNISAPPAVVFQGENIVSGSLADDLNLYSTYCEQIANSEKIIHINLAITDSINTISGSANIDNFDKLQLEDLKLELAIIEKHSDLEYLINGQELHNVVIATQTLDLTSAEIDFTIDYEIEDLENTMLVVWVQTKEVPYNSETCKIYDAQIHDFEIRR